nr:MAG: DNA pilot protein [Microvirus sp.]
MGISALGASIFPSLISGGASFIGGERANQANAKQASKNRSFQERMSSTSHQREVADLKLAGLNPILAAKGGASTPGGSTANIKDSITPALNSALSTRRLKQELLNLEASRLKTNQEADESQTREGYINTQNRLLKLQLPEAIINSEFFTSEGGELMKLLQKFGVTPSSAKALKQLMSKGKSK